MMNRNHGKRNDRTRQKDRHRRRKSNDTLNLVLTRHGLLVLTPSKEARPLFQFFEI